uniref:Uncharacterized protein n=1 Tax=Glossina austeni TaxID=7395 RepID=A0A1A9UNY6_GLOAU
MIVSVCQGRAKLPLYKVEHLSTVRIMNKLSSKLAMVKKKFLNKSCYLQKKKIHVVYWMAITILEQVEAVTSKKNKSTSNALQFSFLTCISVNLKNALPSLDSSVAGSKSEEYSIVYCLLVRGLNNCCDLSKVNFNCSFTCITCVRLRSPMRSTDRGLTDVSLGPLSFAFSCSLMKVVFDSVSKEETSDTVFVKGNCMEIELKFVIASELFELRFSPNFLSVLSVSVLNLGVIASKAMFSFSKPKPRNPLGEFSPLLPGLRNNPTRLPSSFKGFDFAFGEAQIMFLRINKKHNYFERSDNCLQEIIREQNNLAHMAANLRIT